MEGTGESPTKHRRRRVWLTLAAQAAFFWGLWLLLAGKLEPAELVAGAVAATLASAASLLVRSRRLAPAEVRLRWVRYAPLLPKAIVMGTGRVFLVLLRQVTRRGRSHRAPSRLQTTTFELDGAPQEIAARRALAIAYTNTSPDLVVVDITGEPPGRGEMLYHRMDDEGVPEIARRLGARG
ncbi:MAG TPA: hypothetical protein VHH90_08550 [Polyangia bacterium]|nr:hypothetical protein [Polyangia bacterium]